MSAVAKRKGQCESEGEGDPTRKRRKTDAPIEIKNCGKIKRYVARACAQLEDSGQGSAELVALDGNITKAITVLEIIKRKHDVDSQIYLQSSNGTQLTISIARKAVQS